MAELLRRAAAAEGLDADALGIADQLARALMGAGESLAVWWGEHPEEPVERVALVLMNFAWNGLGGLIDGRTLDPARPRRLVEPQHLRALHPVHPGVADALQRRSRASGARGRGARACGRWRSTQSRRPS